MYPESQQGSALRWRFVEGGATGRPVASHGKPIEVMFTDVTGGLRNRSLFRNAEPSLDLVEATRAKGIKGGAARRAIANASSLKLQAASFERE